MPLSTPVDPLHGPTHSGYSGTSALVTSFFKDYFWCFVFIMIDSGEQTGSEVGEREEGRIGKGPRTGIRNRDACNAMTLYVNALPIWLSAPTALATSIRYLPS